MMKASARKQIYSLARVPKRTDCSCGDQDKSPRVAGGRTSILSSATIVVAIISSLCLLLVTAEQIGGSTSTSTSQHSNQLMSGSGIGSASNELDRKEELRDELKSIVDNSANDKSLAEEIISRMLVSDMLDSDELSMSQYSPAISSPNVNNDIQSSMGDQMSPVNGNAVNYLRTILAMNGQAIGKPFPDLPNSWAATAKRAGKPSKHQRQNNYGRNFDFGLGKRPDLTSGGVSRMGDSIPTSSSSIGRPSNRMFEFGLGKRVPSTYPRYDFGLGKRRYDFGLGK